MKCSAIWPVIGALLLLTGNTALADDADDDATMATIRLMSNAEAELPDAVIKEIRLPEALREDSQAVVNSARGLDTANSNRSEGNAGLETAEEARQHGAEMAEAAKENRENQGRSDEHRKDPPETPAQNAR